MSEGFKLEIINPEKSFFSSENVNEVIIPAFEGDMGILKDHISIISFLKPGIIKVLSNNVEEKFYVEDGIVEFKDNHLSILTSSILNIKDIDKSLIDRGIKDAEGQLQKNDIDDQKKFIIEQKIETLKNISIN